MSMERQSNILSTITIILILSQVLLSAAVVLRLNNLEQRILAVLNNQVVQPEIPGFIDNVSIDDDPRVGTEEASIVMVEFGDYECPFCAEAVNNVDTIMSEYDGKVLFVYRDFPLEHIHPNAFQAAEAANCAGDQNAYWEMHDLLFTNQAQLGTDNLKNHAFQLGLDMNQFNDCLESHKYRDEINKDIQDGINYQVNATPTFFINGQRIVGGSLEQLKGTIDILLNNK